MKLLEMTDPIGPVNPIGSETQNKTSNKLNKKFSIQNCIECNCYFNKKCKKYKAAVNQHGYIKVNYWLNNPSSENNCKLHNSCSSKHDGDVDKTA